MIDKKSLSEGLDQMSQSAVEVAGKNQANTIVEDSALLGKSINLESDQPVFTEEDPTNLAGVGSYISKGLKKGGKY